MGDALAFRTGSLSLSSRQPGDLDQSILRFTKAILFPLPRDAPPSIQNIVQAFHGLTLCIFFRVMDSRRPEDVKCCIRFFRYMHGQRHQVSMKFPIPVTTALVQTLAVQVELDSGDVDQDIEEMAGLCDELLSSNISTRSVTIPIADFVKAISLHFKDHLEWKIRSEKATDCLRKVILRLPDLHQATMSLARSLYDRFVVTPSDDHYKGAMAILDTLLIFRGSGDKPSPYMEQALKLAALFADIRFHVYGKPEHLEHAIYRIRAWLVGTTIEDPDRAEMIENLSRLEGLRLGDTTSSQGVLSVPPEQVEQVDAAMIPPFPDLIAPFPYAKAMKPNSTEALGGHLDALQTCRDNQLNDIAGIEDDIKYCRHLIVSYPRTEVASAAQATLCKLLYRAFQYTHKIGYLDEAILANRHGINTANSFHSRVTLLVWLISLLSTRLRLLSHEEDLDELMQLFSTVADHSLGGPHAQLTRSFDWATTARRFRHPSASTAYNHALSLFQASLTFAPTLDKQHSWLVTTRGNLQKIPLHYASYQIHTGHLEQAVEILERGRGLLWSEMRGLRTSSDQIRLADFDLADKFSEVNRELETLAFSLKNIVGLDNDSEGMDAYGHSVVQKQKLLNDREKLITQIQDLPGFDTFLKPPSFDALRSAASHGPVILISHCEWRSDILILLYNSPPSLIHTPEDFYTRANKLQDQVLEARRMHFESDVYEDALRAVLKGLYELVGRPVIKRLDELRIPEQSRVWWCPTSVFCSLPLHAMGPIPSDKDPPRYFLDLYIPSYTPSLSALIDSHKCDSQTSEKPSILLVSQPDESMVCAWDEIRAVQRASSPVTALIRRTATPGVVLERLLDHRFVHIACHGILELGKPFDSSFKLYRGKRLSLHDIVQSQLPNAEFAFLAACHTAELTEESPADEFLHLVAAMQYCGFRSVVGTMWAMADVDGPHLAKSFYNSVFSGREHGVPYHERTAEALRDAVVRLRSRRGRGMTLERWVNYVHYGA